VSWVAAAAAAAAGFPSMSYFLVIIFVMELSFQRTIHINTRKEKTKHRTNSRLPLTIKQNLRTDHGVQVSCKSQHDLDTGSVQTFVRQMAASAAVIAASWHYEQLERDDV
jgi:ABC-type nickel/cobalt efflux system permease component RcnA